MGSNDVDTKRSSPYIRYADQWPNAALERLARATTNKATLWAVRSKRLFLAVLISG
jgi:hypothetical protein